jgi:hypothetical protein
MPNVFIPYKHINTDNLPAPKLKQLQYESDALKRLLGFMTEENIHLKNRISEILKDQFNKNMLEEVEIFHTDFIKEDILIGFLRHDVALIDKLMAKDKFDDGEIDRIINKKLKKLHKNIIIAERHFGKLKWSFNNYLSENL